ncbi:Arsenite methyltransferase [Phytophthora boehmeriae]|uniref:Arsenite methyltransferase n=1 Tax=Phytophthora boehmeriae TaxID=109152 RepID=A0A8T1XA18_9STRA|nr:Arsenite methyltransferase [Phytophthora boehmeriae]
MRFIVGEYGGTSDPICPSKTPEDNALKDLQGKADVVVCNCSIQSLEFPISKNAMLELAFGLLKVGGELRLTDLVNSRRLTPAERENARNMVANAETPAARSGTRQLELQLLLSAPYIGDLRRLYRTLSSDIDARSLSCSEAEGAAIDGAVASLLPSVGATGDVRFRRVTFRLYRLEDPEHPREDYGQTAVFHGGDLEKTATEGGNATLSYQLDDEFTFQKGECVAIDSNTAQILRTSWLHSFFSVSGDCSRHRGPFIPGRTHTTSTSLLFSLSSDSAAVVQSIPSQASEPATSGAERIEMVDI